MQSDRGALRLGDGPSLVLRIRIDDQQLVDELVLLHQLASRGTDDRPDRCRLVERWQDRADGHALTLLERDESSQVTELRVVIVRLGEPAIDPGRGAPPLLDGALGRLQRLGLLGALLEGRAVDRVARLDDDDRRPRVLRHLFGQDPE